MNQNFLMMILFSPCYWLLHFYRRCHSWTKKDLAAKSISSRKLRIKTRSTFPKLKKLPAAISVDQNRSRTRIVVGVGVGVVVGLKVGRRRSSNVIREVSTLDDGGRRLATRRRINVGLTSTLERIVSHLFENGLEQRFGSMEKKAPDGVG